MQHEVLENSTKIKTAMDAILKQARLQAEYNGQVLELDPHQLFVRHGDIYIRALNPNKNRRMDDEPRLGVFKLSGLKQLRVSETNFEPLASFDAALSGAEEHSLLAVGEE